MGSLKKLAHKMKKAGMQSKPKESPAKLREATTSPRELSRESRRTPTNVRMLTKESTPRSIPPNSTEPLRHTRELLNTFRNLPKSTLRSPERPDMPLRNS